MPKLYEYLGIIILFYSNEHDPIHVHGKYQGKESKAEIIIEDGEIIEIRFTAVRGRNPLASTQMKHFQTLVEYYAEDIVGKWIDYFILHKTIEAQVIRHKLK